jgi:TPR repeat protein
LYIKNAKANELSQMAHTYYTAAEIADYTDGYSVGRDCKKAAELFQAAESKMGSVTDQYERGNIYEQIARFFDDTTYCASSHDHQKAIAYFKMSAASGNGWAQMELDELQSGKKK